MQHIEEPKPEMTFLVRMGRHFSSWSRLVRRVAWLRKFCQWIVGRHKGQSLVKMKIELEDILTAEQAVWSIGGTLRLRKGFYSVMAIGL